MVETGVKCLRLWCNGSSVTLTSSVFGVNPSPTTIEFLIVSGVSVPSLVPSNPTLTGRVNHSVSDHQSPLPSTRFYRSTPPSCFLFSFPTFYPLSFSFPFPPPSFSLSHFFSLYLSEFHSSTPTLFPFLVFPPCPSLVSTPEDCRGCEVRHSHPRWSGDLELSKGTEGVPQTGET